MDTIKARRILVSNLEKLQSVQTQEFVARSSESPSITRLSFDIVQEEFLKRDNDGNTYITGVIANTDEHKDGEQFTEELLISIADEINNQGFIADDDHVHYDEALAMGGSTEFIKRNILNKAKGLARTVKAIYENGKLFVRFLVNKAEDLLDVKGISIEGLFSRNKEGKFNKGDFLGLTFIKNKTAALNGTGLMI